MIERDTPSGSSQGSDSVGAALSAVRLARGLSVEDVAGRLRLKVAQIEAIEADRFGLFPGHVFARGYVRSYARLLGVDEAPMLSAMDGQRPESVACTDLRLLHKGRGAVLGAKRHRGWTFAAAGLACMACLLVVTEFGLNNTDVEQPRPQAGIIMAPVASSVMRAVAQKPQDSSVQAVKQEQSAAHGAARVADEGGLHFLFSRESWVEVRDGVGKILFSQLNAPGTEHRINGEPPFNVVIGGAQGVQLAYNGTRIDLASHATEDVARLRLE